MISPHIIRTTKLTKISGDYFVPVENNIAKLEVDGNLSIERNAYVTSNSPCKGLFINVKGTLEIDGTISMEGRGVGSLTRPNCIVDIINQKVIEVNAITYNRIKNLAFPGNDDLLFSNGGRGGKGNHGGFSNSNNVGQSGKGWLFGGGAGGSGQGAANASYSHAESGYSLGGGTGAQGDSYWGIGCSGGGAGNPYGKYGFLSDSAKYHGTGGFLFIKTENIIISSRGNINSNGSRGKNSWKGSGSGAEGTTQGTRGGGGGSGAGFVYIVYSGKFINAGKISATGGACGTKNDLPSENADSTTPIIINQRYFSWRFLY